MISKIDKKIDELRSQLLDLSKIYYVTSWDDKYGIQTPNSELERMISFLQSIRREIISLNTELADLRESKHRLQSLEK